MELLKTMQCLDTMLKKVVSIEEQEEPIGRGSRTLSPITESVKEQVASGSFQSEIDEKQPDKESVPGPDVGPGILTDGLHPPCAQPGA